MTENAPLSGQGAYDPLSMAGLLDSSLRPGGSVSLTFSDGIIHVMLDQTGDWTITAALSVLSDRLLSLTRSLEELGFFQAAEQVEKRSCLSQKPTLESSVSSTMSCMKTLSMEGRTRSYPLSTSRRQREEKE